MADKSSKEKQLIDDLIRKFYPASVKTRRLERNSLDKASKDELTEIAIALESCLEIISDYKEKNKEEST